MTRLNIMTATMAVIFAVTAIAASSAFAAKHGEFVNSSHGTVKGTISQTSSGSAVFENKAGVRVTCTSSNGSGTASNSTRITITSVLWKGCKKTTGGTCKSSGFPAETISIGEISEEIVRNLSEGSDQVLSTLGTGAAWECAEVKWTIEKGRRIPHHQRQPWRNTSHGIHGDSEMQSRLARRTGNQ